MPDYSWRRALILILLGMGIFFTIAALLALLMWLTIGNWRPLLEEIAVLAALATMPVASHLWERYVAHRL